MCIAFIETIKANSKKVIYEYCVSVKDERKQEVIRVEIYINVSYSNTIIYYSGPLSKYTIPFKKIDIFVVLLVTKYWILFEAMLCQVLHKKILNAKR